MAIFFMSIHKDDGTVIDEITATMPDASIDASVAAFERRLVHDAEGNLLSGGRAVTTAILYWLTDLTLRYVDDQVKSQALKDAAVQKAALNQLTIT